MNAKELGKQPANPHHVELGGSLVMCGGLTKREAFAMAAMQGLCADNTPRYESNEGMAEDAVGIADAMLAELAKPQD